MMGKRSRNKGYRTEHNLVLELRDHGIEAKRVPLSGAADFLKCDLVINGMTAEVKARGNGFKEIYRWLEGKELLFLKADYKQYLVVMTLEQFVKLLRGEAK